MAMPPSALSGSPPFNPGRYAIWVQRWTDPEHREPGTLQVRHPTAPFFWNLDAIDNETEIRKAALEYLKKLSEYDQIEPRIRYPEGWLLALDPTPPDDAKFGWLPIGWPVEDPVARSSADPYRSFRAKRTSPHQHQTIILFASQMLRGEFIGSEFGLRVMIHADELPQDQNPASPFRLRITGVSATFPPATAVEIYNDDVFARHAPLVDTLFAPEIETVKRALDLSDMQLRGFRVTRRAGQTVEVERRCWGLSKASGAGPLATPYHFVYRETFSNDGRRLGDPVVIHRTALIADARPGHAKVFLRDPASQDGPTNLRKRGLARSEKQLNGFRADQEITAGQKDPFRFPDDGRDLQVVVCPAFVRKDRERPAGSPKQVALPNTDPDQPCVRSDDFSAVSALHAVRDLFVRLEAYGLPAQDYFRIAKLPLEVSYRSAVRPGPGKDGQTVNAQVRVKGWREGNVGPTPAGEHPSLEMHLALANLAHRARKPWDSEHRSPAEPLGIAADARWIWHEIGHVLLMASVGELEFRFAHSPGDALAAIVADPDSKLALRDLDPNYPEARGRTFPWVDVPRRHDRRASRGWSWCGCMHRDLAEVPDSKQPRRKGYWSEQILSSSLFRVYRCLGGDTASVPGREAANAKVRRSASHYSVYLIMRGLQLLGTSGIQLANDPDQFVTALIHADSDTHEWDVSYPLKCDETPIDPPPAETYKRVGGCAHKVIRWAFEAQGLYAAYGKITNGPGLPPPVDVYVPDDRQAANPEDYAPGNYAPVSLDWDPDQAESDPRPRWQASDAGIKVQDQDIRVTVANRGSEPAENVEVRVWWRAWPAGSAFPQWPEAGWTECTPAVQIPSIGGGDSEAKSADFSHAPPAGRYIVFAQANCHNDPANTDPLTGLPCSSLATPLLDLVPNDNNLGLRVIGA